jgi:retinol dehydrogenase-12
MFSNFLSVPFILMILSQATIMKPAVYAAYSELYAAYSPDVKPEQNGGHLMAWGRPADMPPYIAEGFKSESEGGTGVAEKFFEYSNREIKEYL